MRCPSSASGMGFVLLIQCVVGYLESDRIQMNTPYSVPLGQDIIVHWNAAGKMNGVTSRMNEWMGLFPVGQCEQPQIEITQPNGAPAQYLTATDYQNTCHVAVSRSLTPASAAGTERFTYESWRWPAGKYEVRIFGKNK